MEAKATPLQRKSRNEEGVCLTFYVDEEKVSRVQDLMPEEDAVHHIADIFGVLSEPTRVRILFALSHAELCVCDLAKIAGRSLPATSHQLQILRRMGLVKYRIAGRLAYYTLHNAWIRRLVKDAVSRTNGEAGR